MTDEQSAVAYIVGRELPCKHGVCTEHGRYDNVSGECLWCLVDFQGRRYGVVVPLLDGVSREGGT